MSDKSKIVFLIPAIIILGFDLRGQSLEEVSRINYTQPIGNVSSVSLGGAQGAWKSNVASSVVNPAILGRMENSQGNFMPAFEFENIKSDYYDFSGSDQNFNVNISNLSFYINTYQDRMVYSDEDEEEIGSEEEEAEQEEHEPQPLNLGVALYRESSYKRKISVEGLNPRSSLTDYYAELSRGVDYRSFVFTDGIDRINELAYLTYLTDTSGNEATESIASGGDVYQNYTIDEQGSTNNLELNMGYAPNEKISYGASVGISIYSYSHQIEFKEVDTNNVHPYYDNQRFNPNLKNTSASAYFVFGVLYQLGERSTVGLSYKYGGRRNILSDFDAFLDAQFTNHPQLVSFSGDSTIQESQGTDLVNSRYYYIKPGKWRAAYSYESEQFVFNLDVESINYRGSRFVSKGQDNPNISIDEVNEKIKMNFNNRINVMSGMQFQHEERWYRFGFRVLSLFDKRYRKQTLSLGYGMKRDNVLFDVGLLRSWQNLGYALYEMPDNSAEVDQKRVGTDIVIGIGMVF